MWRFTDNCGTFESDCAHRISGLYFPLCNEKIMSSVSPDLHGDIKTGENSFLLTPVSRIDLVDARSSRNFWVYINKDKIWSATGVSKDLRQMEKDKFYLEAGLLWHKITRENKCIGLKAEILSFVPAGNEPVEITQVRVTNVTTRNITFIPTASIPIYARSAANLRDHRHVTSLLQRITLHKFGVIVKPTLVFDESGHRPNKNYYFVLGWDQNFKAPQYLYPTQEMFCGEGGDLEAPLSVLRNLPPGKERIQGKEAMGGLRFRKVTLRPRQSQAYIILAGISDDKREILRAVRQFNRPKKVEAALKITQDFWKKKADSFVLSSGDADFANWFRWVSIQPALRRIFGCSFLPDFDYGKGGRGWRDLWQDCLGLIFSNPAQARKILTNNFSGVRIDGSHATIVGKKPGEFIADRNNLSRVWMDHGVWPLLTTDLYLKETGDFSLLFREAPYFRDQQIFRSRGFDHNWSPAAGNKLKTPSGKVYQGTILEHLLVENLVQFFNVGAHNHVRLEGGDWNDGLDMARDKGESVAFSCMYAYNLGCLAEILLSLGQKKIKIARELKILFTKTDYRNIQAKQKILKKYFEETKSHICGEKFSIDSDLLAKDLLTKSEWMKQYIRKKEWLKQGFFNGYYDNKNERVEGLKNGQIRMTLTAQVFAIMSGVATDEQIKSILENTKKYLWDKRLKGYRLNTDFKEEQHHLGRAFSFVYGDKENGAFFNHMAVMFAYALLKRGYAKEGEEVLDSVYRMSINTPVSKIYPCLPEYFNAEGRGMYSYLTGSASWFMLATRLF